MNQPQPQVHQLLQHIDQLIAQAPDEATRVELKKLRERLDTPEMRDLARDLSGPKPANPSNLVLEFHDPLLPTVVTATGAVIAAAVCVFAVVNLFKSPTAWFGTTEIKLWVIATLGGAFTALFTALSFIRTFSVRFDTEGMASRASGGRWQQLRVGAMEWPSIRSLRERLEDRILEVRTASGKVLDIPMRLVNYPILHQHLENMVRLYGDRA